MHKAADQYVVRFPDGMRDQIKALAKANLRSMNAEIIFALEARIRATAGGEFGDLAPAVASRTDALPGVNSTNG
ncbi:Arc family DNA-binding protein [Nitratireductor sp. ac15]